MQTPNLTSPPVLKGILRAVRRGVNIRILTSEKLMILEQLVTAGTTTARCIRKLIKLYKHHRKTVQPFDEEAALAPIGQLTIDFYTPRPDGQKLEGEPLQSHLKLTIVDNKWVVLGSGNQDRASWYTSQELGVAFNSAELAAEIQRTVDSQMHSRRKSIFDSTTD